MEQSLETLKGMVKTKLDLEKRGQTDTKEYYVNNNYIQTFFIAAVKSNLTYFKNVAEREYKNKVSFLGSGIGGKVAEKANDEADIYFECLRLIKQKEMGKTDVTAKYSTKKTFGEKTQTIQGKTY